MLFERDEELENPVDALDYLIREMAEEMGLELVPDYEERIEKIRAYCEELIELTSPTILV